MIDQCLSETDIVNSCLISLPLTLKYFIIKKWRQPGVLVILWALALVHKRNIFTFEQIVFPLDLISTFSQLTFRFYGDVSVTNVVE